MVEEYPEADLSDDHWTSRATLGAAGELSVTFFAVVEGSVVGLVAAYPRAESPGRLRLELGEAARAATPAPARKLLSALAGR